MSTVTFWICFMKGNILKNLQNELYRQSSGVSEIRFKL